MAISKNTRMTDTWGSHHMSFIDVTFDDSYPTGGLAFDAIDTTIDNIAMAICFGSAGYDAIYDEANKKVLLIDRNTGNEPSPGTNTSGVTVHVLVVGEN